jgi:hypothetical protein
VKICSQDLTNQKKLTMLIQTSRSAAPAPAAAQIIAAAQMSNAQGVYDYSQGKGDIDYSMLPDNTTYTATSTAGSADEDKTMYIFNEDTYNESPTNNGSGANSIVKSYDDGFSGKLINKLIGSANGGRGMLCHGFNVQFTVAASGNQDQGALSTAAFTVRYYNGRSGNYNPFNIDLNQAVRNTQYVSGLLTIRAPFWLNSTSQISFLLPQADKAVFTFFWKPFTV